MKIYDEQDKNYIIKAYKTKRPSMKKLLNWYSCRCEIEKETITLWNWVIKGGKQYFEYKGQWYFIDDEYIDRFISLKIN